MIRRVRLRGAVVFVLPLSVLAFCGLEAWGQGAFLFDRSLSKSYETLCSMPMTAFVSQD